MKISFDIKKKEIYFLSFVAVFLIGMGLVIAYGDFSSGVPSILGHSSDEIDVKNASGDIVTLQEFIDQGGGSGGGGGAVITEFLLDVPSGTDIGVNRDCFAFVTRVHGGDCGGSTSWSQFCKYDSISGLVTGAAGGGGCATAVKCGYVCFGGSSGGGGIGIGDLDIDNIGERNTYNIGVDRTCFAFPTYFYGDYSTDTFSCNYNSTTGDVVGGETSSREKTSCGHVCFD